MAPEFSSAFLCMALVLSGRQCFAVYYCNISNVKIMSPGNEVNCIDDARQKMMILQNQL